MMMLRWRGGIVKDEGEDEGRQGRGRTIHDRPAHSTRRRKPIGEGMGRVLATPRPAQYGGVEAAEVE
jgi:hypothetical protein